MDSDKLLSSFSNSSIKYEKDLDKLLRKKTGRYFTSIDLTLSMMQELINSLDNQKKKNLFSLKFFEPCVGTGNFVFAYLFLCKNLLFSKDNYIELLNNIYVCDTDVNALELYKTNLTKAALDWFGITLNKNYFKNHIGSGLLFDVECSKTAYIPLLNVFPENIIKNGFDIIVTNPPYKNLKAERSQYTSAEEYELDQSKYQTISKLVSENLKYSNEGTLNLYKLFVEEIVEKYSNESSVFSLLVPASILSDKTCSKLRSRIIQTCSITSLRIISEDSKFVDASQALCAMLFKKGEQSGNVIINGKFDGDTSNDLRMKLGDIIDPKSDNSIMALSANEYNIWKKMKSFPTIGQLDYIVNRRGELDISLNKDAITTNKTKYLFARGRNIGYYQMIKTKVTEYAKQSFVDSTTKREFIKEERLVCQQIVNMAKKRRVSFTIVPKNVVLGNSCNFISLKDNDDNIDLYFLLGILNSSLIDWYFKLTSSNNHINNYEIDTFPIPIKYNNKAEIVELVKKYLTSFDDEILRKIDVLVYEAYGIRKTTSKVLNTISQDVKDSSSIVHNTSGICNQFYKDISQVIPQISIDDCKLILNNQASIVDVSLQRNQDISKFDKKVLSALEAKYRSLNQEEILNHTTFKLSDLDLEMIKNVPQGGNWKNIPQSTVKKSKRLERITHTGGRTTLYGRIDYNKPSYTITTYFNRPGNGTYVHPVHERVLSVREASRFQTFPDDYLFYGNKTDMLKQVGNAVPVLLAYNIGKSIVEKTGCHSSVDLFSGAGGMTYGFKCAGIKALIASDIFENACVTLKTNSPEIPVLCGDITIDSTKQKIIKAGIDGNADIICGGPPCQGFSMAGFRRKDDPRNQLFRDFVDIVSKINPKIIVFENVEGLLSYQGGKTYKSIIELFSELGYYAEGRSLFANEYGVPQKRKRVIILCTRKDLHIMPDELYPTPLTEDSKNQMTAKEAIFDLEDVNCSEHAKYNSNYSSLLTKYYKSEMSASDFVKSLSKKQQHNYQEKLDI